MVNASKHDKRSLVCSHSHAHDVLTAFVAKHGFEVTKHYHLETGWRAVYTHGEGGRTIGVNSEVHITRNRPTLVTYFWFVIRWTLCQASAMHVVIT